MTISRVRELEKIGRKGRRTTYLRPEATTVAWGGSAPAATKAAISRGWRRRSSASARARRRRWVRDSRSRRGERRPWGGGGVRAEPRREVVTPVMAGGDQIGRQKLGFPGLGTSDWGRGNQIKKGHMVERTEASKRRSTAASRRARGGQGQAETATATRSARACLCLIWERERDEWTWVRDRRERERAGVGWCWARLDWANQARPAGRAG